MNKKYGIFVSSTYKDLEKERQSVINAVLKLGHFPLSMESFTATDDEQWKTIVKTINDCDYYVLILGMRYGSIDIVDGKSYTEKEYDYALSIGKPILSFVLNESIIDKEDIDDDITNIKAFREKVLGNKKLAQICKNKSELVSDIMISLTKSFSDNPKDGWIRGNGISSNELYEVEKKQLQPIEMDIIDLFKKTQYIDLVDIEKEFKIDNQRLKYHLDNLVKLEYLEFHPSNSYDMDSKNRYELLDSGRKYLYE